MDFYKLCTFEQNVSIIDVIGSNIKLIKFVTLQYFNNYKYNESNSIFLINWLRNKISIFMYIFY